MTNKAILTEAGIIIINDKFEVLQSHRFEPDSEISLYSQIKNSNVPEGVKTFLDDSSHEFSDSLEVNDQSLLEILSKIYPDKNFIYKTIDSSNLFPLFVQSGFFSSEEEISNFLQNFSIEYSKQQIRDVSGKEDLQIIEGINSLDELDKAINILMARINEWYGLHFPELENLVKDSNEYFKFVSLGLNRSSITEKDLDSFSFSEKKLDAIFSAAQDSKGGEINSKDLSIISILSDNVINLVKVRDKMLNYISDLMNNVAPNLSAIAGPTIGARLIAKSGGMMKLARLPSSTIQVLGAEKALFRSLKSGSRPPKHGIIFQHDKVHSSPKWQRGKIARSLAAKIAIAVRIDVFRGSKEIDIEHSLDERYREIQEKYASPVANRNNYSKKKHKKLRRSMNEKRRRTS
ncbi:MAG: NOP5/NOP56 family protein [Nitrososphaerales archaeon]|uniref:Ribosomal biogenesis protein (NOP56) n=2 Tax=environmental samples TaxID=651140 RepID=A0A075G2D3_9ARCH|nr:ribosomal biogenesis protein (NOP56) [uncultured marine thaumarchaeote AD1000_71_A04]AIF05777.1 ribosomal biogenesis protein (NOP56) [uncultured marine thaumarchaeote KM3_187_A08]